MRAVGVVAIGAALVLASCTGLKYQHGSWGGGCAGHTRDSKSGRVDYGVTHLTLNGRVYLVLVAEGGGGSCHAGPPAHGTLLSTDGRAVEWSCDTPDGRTGRVTVGTEPFELDQGAVFLVDLRGEKVVVEQVPVDTRLLQNGLVEDGLKVAARSHERLAAFLERCETPK